MRYFRHERIRRHFCRGGGGSGGRALVPGAAPCRRSLVVLLLSLEGECPPLLLGCPARLAFRFFLRRHEGGARRARPVAGRRRGGRGGVLPHGHSRERSACRGAGLLACWCSYLRPRAGRWRHPARRAESSPCGARRHLRPGAVLTTDRSDAESVEASWGRFSGKGRAQYSGTLKCRSSGFSMIQKTSAHMTSSAYSPKLPVLHRRREKRFFRKGSSARRAWCTCRAARE